MKTRSVEPYPAWGDAHLARKYIRKKKAKGNNFGLAVRDKTQKYFGKVSKCTGKREGVIITIGIVVLAMICGGIKSTQLDTTLASLWTPNSNPLAEELSYVSKVSGLATDTNELLIQTPKPGSHHSILNAKALLEHLEVLQKALSVTVDLYDVTWSLKDICYSANIPTFDVTFLDQIFEKIFPCVVVTPLDCFWEGAKLLGPTFPIQIPGFHGPIKWTHLNPQELLMQARVLVGDANGANKTFEILEGFMKRAGIGSGYQEKPCLNPLDPECPITAPNKGSKTPPDVASILSHGCFGFAPRFMHWAPDLIIGGAVHNKSGHVTKAGGLMSTVQIMSSSELYEFSKGTWRLQHIEWSEAKASATLAAWQTRFTSEVTHLTMDEDSNKHFNFYSFTSSGLDSVVESASQFSWSWGIARVAGVIIASVVVGVFPTGTQKNTISMTVRVFLLIFGSLLALLGTAAGNGVVGIMDQWVRIPFNVASVQVLPYLTMALASQVFYIVLYSQITSTSDSKTAVRNHSQSLFLGISSAAVYIVAGAGFPIPAVRSIALQGAISIVVAASGLMLLYPLLCQRVLRKRKIVSRSENVRLQVVDNMGSLKARGAATPFLPQELKNNKLKGNLLQKNNNVTINATKTDQTSNKNISINMEDENDRKLNENEHPPLMSICKSKNWVELYLTLTNLKWFTGFVTLVYFTMIVVASFGVARIKLGLSITDVVPSHSAEWDFLTAQGKLFPLHHMKAVTKHSFDYPSKQKLLHKFHETMSALPWIIRDDNGGVTPMWLSVFQSWLLKLQDVLDKEWKLGHLHKEGWTKSASADGILAWKLAVQTGHSDHPVDITQLPGNRLVNSEGEINPRAFYVYLTAWAWNDPLAFGSTAANLKPEPRSWVHNPEDKDLPIPKSLPIKYAEITYLLRTSQDDDTQEQNHDSQILDFVREIRKICENFESRGLPVFPWGTPFRFYDQYLNIDTSTAKVLGCAIGATSIMLLVTWYAIRPVAVVVIMSLVTICQIAGTIGWLGIGLNALPVEISLLGTSSIVFASIQIVGFFCCIPGTFSVRYATTFIGVGPPCVQNLVLISFTALILYSPDFTFIFTHFTKLIAIAAIFSLINFLLLLPALLSIIKPRCMLVGLHPEDPSLLLPLTPSPVLKRGSSKSRSSSGGSRTGGRSSSRNNYAIPPYSFRGSNSKNYYHPSSGRGGTTSRTPSEHSLSTITEEPTSCATRRSTEVVVQPQVVVETFDRENSLTTTKVSAKLKVEVHSSVHSNNAHSSVNTSTNMSENSGTSASTSSSGSFTSSSAASSTSSYNDRVSGDD